MKMSIAIVTPPNKEEMSPISNELILICSVEVMALSCITKKYRPSDFIDCVLEINQKDPSNVLI